jgi:hypothetical protein
VGTPAAARARSESPGGAVRADAHDLSGFYPRSVKGSRIRPYCTHAPDTRHLNCVDQVGSTFPGNIFGEVTSWEENLDGSITLNVVGKFVGIPGGHPQDVSFSVTILSFGGAGVGQWTLSIGDDTFCFETLRSGQIVMRRSS